VEPTHFHCASCSSLRGMSASKDHWASAAQGCGDPVLSPPLPCSEALQKVLFPHVELLHLPQRRRLGYLELNQHSSWDLLEINCPSLCICPGGSVQWGRIPEGLRPTCVDDSIPFPQLFLGNSPSRCV
jgi:hypothetical protein